jgi:plasmid replication protein rep and AAA-class ATPase domain protein
MYLTLTILRAVRLGLSTVSNTRIVKRIIRKWSLIMTNKKQAKLTCVMIAQQFDSQFWIGWDKDLILSKSIKGILTEMVNRANTVATVSEAYGIKHDKDTLELYTGFETYLSYDFENNFEINKKDLLDFLVAQVSLNNKWDLDKIKTSSEDTLASNSDEVGAEDSKSPDTSIVAQ